MIIGISGKIGSGKDTIGNIIQYLTLQNEYPNVWKDKNFEEFLNFGTGEGQHTWKSDWQVKKFAGKLKRVVSFLTGYSLEDLEKQEIKDTLLSDEWQVFHVYTLENSSLVHPNRMISIIFQTEDEAIEKIKQNSSYITYTYEKSQRTVRWLLQFIGTDLFRDRLHENIHIIALFVDYKALNQENSQSILSAIDYSNCKFPDWLITDMRFPNEIKAVKDREGITIRVNRQLPVYIIDKNKSIAIEHPSETALDNYNDFDYVIDNNETIEELISKVKEILIKEKIL